MNIFYWSVAHLFWSDNSAFVGDSCYDDFHNSNRMASYAMISIFGLYALIRFCFNRIGGLYMIKRLSIAVIMAAAVYDKQGYLAVLIGAEIIFTILRYCLERPRTTCDKVTIFIEWLLYSIGYTLMFVVFVTGVTAFIVMAIVFIMLIWLISDLIDTYLNSESQFN